MRSRSTMPYRIEYDPKVRDHFGCLSTRDRATVLDCVDRQLLHQPMVPTRNRKLLRASELAPWELRIGHLRVYYEVSDADEPVVTVRAVGIKVRDRVLIGGVEVEP
jgi:mRNA-degrading endonuclease RelE of RelBE toxin-antitoxin system